PAELCPHSRARRPRRDRFGPGLRIELLGEMMMNRRLGFLLSALLVAGLAPRPAASQDRSDVSDATATHVLRGDTYIGAQVGIDFLGDTNYKCRCDARQSDFLLYGGRFGHFFTDHVALEGTVNWIDLHPGFWDASLGLMYDF